MQHVTSVDQSSSSMLDKTNEPEEAKKHGRSEQVSDITLLSSAIEVKARRPKAKYKRIGHF